MMKNLFSEHLLTLLERNFAIVKANAKKSGDDLVKFVKNKKHIFSLKAIKNNYEAVIRYKYYLA